MGENSIPIQIQITKNRSDLLQPRTLPRREWMEQYSSLLESAPRREGSSNMNKKNALNTLTCQNEIKCQQVKTYLFKTVRMIEKP